MSKHQTSNYKILAYYFPQRKQITQMRTHITLRRNSTVPAGRWVEFGFNILSNFLSQVEGPSLLT